MGKKKEIIEAVDKSYRIIWEIDVDAPNANQAARLAYDSILNGIRPVFEVHQWKEPEMKELEPVAFVDLNNGLDELPVPETRVVSEQYMGPDIV